MAVTNTVKRVNYVGDAVVTTFAITPYFTESSQVKVYVDGVLKTTPTHYSVTGTNVVFVAAPAAAAKVLIVVQLPLTQIYDFSSQVAVTSQQIESSEDRIVLQVQQLQDLIDRCVRFSVTHDLSTFSPVLPTTVVGAAGAYLRINDAGDGIVEGATAFDVENAEEYAQAAEAAQIAAEAAQAAAEDAAQDAEDAAALYPALDARVTVVEADLSATLRIPTKQFFTSTGTTNYLRNNIFVISSGNASAGATYTNNGVTFTVHQTVSGSTKVVMRGNGNPTASGTLTKTGGTGDNTLTFSRFIPPAYLIVDLYAGGGAGSGSGTGYTAGGDGGTSSFGSLISCLGGLGGGLLADFDHGAGQAATITAPAYGQANKGSDGGGTGSAAGTGGATDRGGPGVGGLNGISNGYNANPNTGSGGGGAGGNTGGGVNNAGSGASGSWVRGVIVPTPSASYSITIGAKGVGGNAGSGGVPGGDGADGYGEITEVY